MNPTHLGWRACPNYLDVSVQLGIPKRPLTPAPCVCFVSRLFVSRIPIDKCAENWSRFLPLNSYLQMHWMTFRMLSTTHIFKIVWRRFCWECVAHIWYTLWNWIVSQISSQLGLLQLSIYPFKPPVWATRAKDWELPLAKNALDPESVLLFLNLNYIFIGYFDPESIFFCDKNKYVRSEPIFRLKKKHCPEPSDCQFLRVRVTLLLQVAHVE